MSDIFAFDTGATRPLAELAAANSVDSLDELQARPWQGVGEGTVSGILRGGARVAQAAGMAAYGALSLHQQSRTGVKLDDQFTDTYFRGLDEHVNRAVDYWAPDPHDVGKAGQILGGLGEMVLPLAAAGGNPVPLIASQELGSGTDLVREGVDARTATEAGIVTGAATAAGLKVPIIGKTLSSRLASGVAGNALFGAASRAADQAILRDYPDKAPPVFDATTVGMDVLTGALFGGLHHALTPNLIPSQVDALMTARAAKSFSTETTPGVPKGIPAEVAHQSALETALEQLSRSQPVDLSALADTGAEFSPAGRQAESGHLAHLVATSEPIDVPYAPEPTLSDAQIEQRFRSQLDADRPGAIQQYAELDGAMGGRLLNTDLARELSADYRADRTRSAAVHEPASELTKEMYAQRLQEAPAEGQKPMVVFSAGGTGAGKSVGLREAEASLPAVQRAQIVYDTNLNNFDSSVRKIDQALQAGKNVHIVYTWRDPVDSLTQGALPRAMKMGRTVPLVEHANTHVGAAQTIKELEQHYAGDHRVTITAVDNSRGKGEQRVMNVADVPQLDYNRIHEELSQSLDAEHAAGRISEAVYRGTAGGPSEGGPAAGAGDRGSTASSDHPEVVSSLPLSEALAAKPQAISDLPEVASLQQLADEHPEAQVSSVDPDGNDVRTSVSDYAEQIQREYAADLQSAQAYQVAVNCFLGHGA